MKPEELTLYRPLVRHLAGRLARSTWEKDDLEQEAWVALLQMPPGRSPKWAIRSRLSHVIRSDVQHRRKYAHPKAPGSSYDPGDSAQSRIEAAELLAVLPERWGRALMLFYGFGLPWADVGELMGVRPNTAREFGWRGMTRLRALRND